MNRERNKSKDPEENTGEDVRANIPVYLAIENDIMADIENKVYAEGSKLPTERELTEKYSVSRTTIRQVISNLESQGIIYKIMGRGAFVSKKIVQRNMEIKGFGDLMRERGKIPSSKLIEFKKRVANDDERLNLNLALGEEVYILSRIRLADNEPMAIEYSAMVASIFEGLEKFDFENNSLYDIFVNHYHVSMSWATDNISAIQLSGDESQILYNKKRGLALYVINILYDINNKPLEYTKTIYNADKYSYNVVSSKKYIKY